MDLTNNTELTNAPPRITPLELYHEWLSQLTSPKTRRSYTQGWKFFSEANGMKLEETIERFFCDGPIPADSMCARFRAWLIDRNAAGNTINTRFKAITGLLNYARRKRCVYWRLDIKRASSRPVRDTRGPDEEKTQELFEALEGNGSILNIRNIAIARLLYNPALRRFEVTGLDLEHVDLAKSQVNVLGKARGGREWITVPPSTKNALELWMEIRPDVDSKALFIAIDNGHYGQRLSESTIRDILKPFNIRAHGLRHSAITKALEVTNGDIRAVQKFSRHSSPAQVLAYDDCRRDRGGQIANLIDEATEAVA